jgi:glycosyltransferase involved in cell wall biosynthesis
MKILHVVHAYPPSVGGCQTLVERLSRVLAEDHGDCVTVFTTVARNTEHFVQDDGMALPRGEEVRDGVRVRRFPVFNGLTRQRMLLASLGYRFRLPGNELFRTWLNGPIVPGLSQAIAVSGAEVVMASAFPLWHMYAALRGARRGSLPIVLMGALHVEDEWNFDRKMIFRAIRCADAYVALTEFERNHVLSRGAVPGKTHVVGGGVEVGDFQQASGEKLRAGLNIGAEKVVALVSKQVERKRFDLLIEAMVKVRQIHPEAHLVLAGGTTPFSESLLSLIQASGTQAAARTHLLSDLSEAEKAEALAACDVFALPSTRDSFGLVFLEAWACSKPVVGVSAGAIPSVVRHEVDGLLVAPDDPHALAAAIVRLLDDPALARSLGAAGFEKVRSAHSWEKVAEQYRSIYGQISAQTAGS